MTPTRRKGVFWTCCKSAFFSINGILHTRTILFSQNNSFKQSSQNMLNQIFLRGLLNQKTEKTQRNHSVAEHQPSFSIVFSLAGFGLSVTHKSVSYWPLDTNRTVRGSATESQ